MAGKKPDLSKFRMNPVASQPQQPVANNPQPQQVYSNSQPQQAPKPTNVQNYAQNVQPNNANYQNAYQPNQPNGPRPFVQNNPRAFSQQPQINAPTYNQINSNFRPMTTVGPESNSIEGQDIKNPSNKEPRRASRFVMYFALFVILVTIAWLVIPPILPEGYVPANVEVNINCDFELATTGVDTGEEQTLLLPGDSFSSRLTFSLEHDEDQPVEPITNYYMRFRIYALCQDNYYPYLFANTLSGADWTEGLDGYYYYNNLVNHLTPTLEIIEQHTLSESTGNDFNGQTIILEFSLEILQATNDGQINSILSIWPTAPYTWRISFAS